MRRYSFNARRTFLALGASLVASLGVATTAAQAVVLNDTNPGGTQAGVVLTPNTRGVPLPSGVSPATAGPSCLDPWLSSDLGGPTMSTAGLCFRGGGVIHRNETFALTWDAPQATPWALHNYWSQTRGFVERFLRDVADASGSTGSPFAVTAQYNDGGGRAQNASIFGGGCIDNGATGGSACEFGSPTGAGHDFPSGSDPASCTPAGDSFVFVSAVVENGLCLTDAQLQSELQQMIPRMGIVGGTKPGYTPLVTLLLPPGVETCLDKNHTLCSANAFLTPPPPALTTNTTGGTLPDGTYQVELTYETSSGETVPSSAQSITTTGGGKSTITIKSPPGASGVTGWYAFVTGPNGYVYKRLQSSATPINTDLTWSDLSAVTGGGAPAQTSFCSYHSQVNVDGTEVAYVVQPWTAGTACDEPGLPDIPNDPTPQQLSVDVGARLVSPLSQGEIGAIVNPGLNGWVANDGGEIQDNQGCTPLPRTLDQVTVGGSSQNPYFLQREWNNAAALDTDPNTYGCAPSVVLSPDFVVPSSVDQGDEVQFDGSATASTLIVPNHGYAWNFGDGTTATGPSVVHSYSKGGTYNVTLTVTDRGSNVQTLTQAIQVLGSDGQPALPPPTTTSPGSGSGSGPGSGSAGSSALSARLLLLPQSLKHVLHSGIAVRVTSNKAANGIATVSITRAEAKRAHIKVGKGPTVRIGLGTVASITNGTMTLHLHLSPTVAKKLSHLKHLTLTVRLALVAAGNQQLAIDVAGRY
jgi:PKD domain